MTAKKIGRILKDAFQYAIGRYEAPHVRARRMIDDQSINPFYAWREAHGMECRALAARMAGAVADDGTPLPSGIVWPTDDDIVQQFCGSPLMPDAYPSAGFVVAYCKVFDMSPQHLERIVHGEGKKAPVPAPAALVEAAVTMELSAPDADPLNRIFLGLEVAKAALLGSLRGSGEMRTNAEMLEMAERVFEQAAARSPDMIAEDMYEEVSPVEDIRAMQDAVFSHYTATLSRDADANARAQTLLKKRQDVASKTMSRCILTLAETGQQARWVKIFNNLMRERGVEAAFESLRQTPDTVYPMRKYWRSSASLVLPDGRFAIGVGIVDAFIEAMRAYAKDGQDIAVQKNAQKAHLWQRSLFEKWRKLPATETYLRAVANARHIEGEAGDVLARLRREVPNGSFPSLLPPSSPAP